MIDIKKTLAGSVFLVALAVAGGWAEQSESASLTSVSVTLSNPRPSFRGALDTGNAEGTSQVIIDTSGYASESTNQLQTNDTLLVGTAGTMSTYTITNVVSGSQVNVTPVLGSGDADSGDTVISTQSAELSVRFVTANAIEDGTFRILVPAHPTSADGDDGLPDQGYFDFGTATPTVDCPANTSGYTFGTAVATANVTYGGNQYHAYDCPYTGTGGIGTDFTSDPVVIDDIINPAPAVGHTGGTADSYRVILQHLDSGDAVVDSTTVAIGVIEAVRVTAIVAPQITFSIAGVASGQSVCGVTTDVTTTATAVPLGELSISSFTDAAQSLTVSTNAVNGYAVTAIESDQLGLDGQACAGDPDPASGGSCIGDSRGDTTTMSHTAFDIWDDQAATKGFAYSLHNGTVTPANAISFEYNEGSGACTGASYCARQFADAEATQVPQTLFSSTDVANNENARVCYRAVISAIQAAGFYENYVTYTATATF